MAVARRRDLKKESFWLEMVHGHSGSGLSVRAWCRRHDLQESAFYWWRRRLGARAAERVAAAFVPVCVADEAAGIGAGVGTCAGRIEIVLAADCRVQLFGRVDRQALRDVLAVLTQDDFAGEADVLAVLAKNGLAGEVGGNARIAKAGAC